MHDVRQARLGQVVVQPLDGKGAEDLLKADDVVNAFPVAILLSCDQMLHEGVHPEVGLYTHVWHRPHVEGKCTQLEGARRCGRSSVSSPCHGDCSPC